MFLKPAIDKDGYYKVTLYGADKPKRFFIHRLVAEAYIPNPNNLPQVNHKSQIKSENCINNLEWCSAEYNSIYTNGKKVKCVELNKVFDSTTLAAKSMGVGKTAICNCLSGRSKTSAGYHWEYV